MSVAACRRSVLPGLEARVAACTAFVVALAMASAAGATFESTSSVETASGTVTDSDLFSSSVFIDGENFAQSYVLPALGRMGAAASNSLYEGESRASSFYDDSWACIINSCGAPGQPAPGYVPLSLSFKVDGDLTNFFRPNGVGTGVPEVDILARYEIGVFGSFEFRLSQNVFDDAQGPLGAGSRVSALFCHGGSCANLPFDVVTAIDDNDEDIFHFSVNSIGNPLLCPGCAAGFVDSQFIRVHAVGGNNVSMINALQTFEVTVASLDPDFEFASTAGRSTGVPEPARLALLGLLGIGLRRSLGRTSAPDERRGPI